MQSGATCFDKYVYACIHCKMIIEPMVVNTATDFYVVWGCPHCKSEDVVSMGGEIHEHYTYEDIKKRMKETIKAMNELWEIIK